MNKENINLPVCVLIYVKSISFYLIPEQICPYEMSRARKKLRQQEDR